MNPIRNWRRPAGTGSPDDGNRHLGRHRSTDTTGGKKGHRLVAVITTLALGLGMLLTGASAASAATVPGTDSWNQLYTMQNGTLVGCTDAGRAAPGESGWRPYAQSQVNAPSTAYIWWKYGVNPNANQISALSHLTHFATDIPHNNKTSQNPAMSGGVQAAYNAMIADANANKGPYTVTGQVTTAPTATNGRVTVRFTVKSAAGNAQSGIALSFAATGSATGLSRTTGTTNAQGQVTLTYNLANGATGGVRATAGSLPATSVTMYTPDDADSWQRMIGRGPASTKSGTAQATRPAAPKSYVRVVKRDATTNAVLAGAKFRIETTGGTVLASGTTSASGVWSSGALNVAPGTTVRVRETAAPAGYEIDTATKNTTTGSSSPGRDITFTDTKLTSILRIHKTDAQTGAALAGAKFTVKSGSTTLGSGTTNAAGNIDLTVAVAPGTTVTVTETGAPASYTMVTTSKTVSTGQRTRPQVSFANDQQSKVTVHKTDAATGKVLAGAKFTIKSAAGTTLATGTTGSNGNWVSPYLPVKPGTRVRVTETAAPTGYLIDTATKTVTTTRAGNGGAVVNFTDTPQGKVSVMKTDAATGKPLAGAKFTVYTTAGAGLTTLTTGANGLATSGFLGSGLGVGDKVNIKETTAPAGYTRSKVTQTVTITVDGTGTARWTLSDPRAIAGAISVKKTDSTNGAALAGAEFTVEVQKVGSTTWTAITGGAAPGTTEATPGHYVTGSNGMATVNGNDTSTKIANGDKVRFTEVQAPEGYHQPEGADAQVVGTVGTDLVLTVSKPNTPFQPNIGTTATNSNTELGKMVVGGSTVIDTVKWNDFAPGDYTMTGQLMLVDGDDVTPVDGVTTSPVDFTVAEGTTTGTVQVEFTLPNPLPADLEGKTLVVYETATVKGETDSYAEHKNPSDEGQSVMVPQIGTTATNSDDTLGKMVTEGSLVDTVAYSNLTPGKEYTVSGEFQLVVDGKATATGITGTATFTPETSSGTVDVTFPVSADQVEQYKGEDLVAFETVKLGDVTLAIHADVTDEAQTVHVPEIGTTAVNADDTQGKVVTAGSKVIDTIAYENLQPGVEYTASGEFQLVVDGKATATGITGTATFTPESASGTVDVEFTMPSDVSDYEGKTLVAFETVKTGEVTVAIHADVTDEGQTVYVPGIGTTATNADSDAGKNVTPGGTLIDTIAYSGLQPGQEYTASGEFQIVVDGKATPSGVTGTATFTPDTTSGTVDVEFKVPADLTKNEGQTWVAFETVKQGDVTVAIHADVDDIDQTVYVPGIGTTATNGDTDLGKTVTEGTLVDTIAYRGLQPGKEYTASGEFQLVVDGKAQPTGITGTATFTPQDTDGTVKVTFDVPAELVEKYKGDDLVAFETVKSGDTVVAIHADVTDEAQTVHVPEIGTTAANADENLVKTAPAGTTVIDSIAYSNLTAGVEYTVSGEFQAIVDGNPVATGMTGTATFTAEKSSGTVDVEFKVPAKVAETYAGQSLVAFETVKQGDVIVAIHADITDKAQTVYVPQIGTTATNANADLGKVVTAGKLVDTIAYTNLPVGKPMTASGEFMVVVDGKTTSTGIVGTATFIPEKSSGTVTVEFPVSADMVTKYAGQSLVAFETVKSGDVTIAVHADSTDQGQTVYVPTIGTTAANADEAFGKTVTVGKLTDTIAYQGLTPGAKYVASGEFQAVVDGKATPTGIKGTAAFTPEKSSGTVTVTFDVPQSVVDRYAGQTLVAFETVKSGDVTVAVHADVKDKAQTVYVPKIGTTLMGPGESRVTVDAQGGVTLTDRIAFTNLTPGVEYVAKGELKFADGSPTGVKTADTVFTPKSANGSVDVAFTVPGDLLASGKTLVVAFETVEQVSKPGVTVASHQDLHATSQTLELSFGSGQVDNSAGTGAIPSGLGAESNPGLPLLIGGMVLLLLAGAGFVFLVARRTRNSKSE